MYGSLGNILLEIVYETFPLLEICVYKDSRISIITDEALIISRKSD